MRLAFAAGLARLGLLLGVQLGSPLVAQPPPEAQAPATAAKAAPQQQETTNALRQRAFAAENERRFGDAADAFTALARAEPDRIEWTVAAGRNLGLAGRFREALDLLDAARKRVPQALELQAMLARTLLLQAESGRDVVDPRVLWADAADLAEAVLAADPGHEDSRLSLAHARYQLGDRDEAVRHAEEAARRHPERAGAHVLLGRIAGDRFRALLREHDARKKAENPDPQELADLVGRIDEQRQLAQRSYRRAAELDPKRPHPHVALGQLAWVDRDHDVARKHFGDALAIDPQAPVDHDGMWSGTDWRQRAAFYAEARNRYAAGTGPRPEKVAALQFHEGRARFEGQDWKAARACLDAALAGDPTALNAHWYLFLAAYHDGDHDGAERHAVAYVQRGAPGFADEIRALGGEARAGVGTIVEFLANRAFAEKRVPASRDLNHVIACLKDSADAWNNHAFLCRETGRFDDALASYQHALEKEPDSPQLLNDCAVILQYHLPNDANNKAKARELYERALRLAGEQLADARVTGDRRARAEQARRDATANLKALQQP